MHEYMTRHMVARKPMTYAEQDLHPGDEFRATPDDAAYLEKHGKADCAPDVVSPVAEEAKTEPAAHVVQPVAAKRTYTRRATVAEKS